MRPSTQIAAATNHGTTSVSSSKSFPANIGRKTSGPSAAPKSAPKRTYEIARAFRSCGYMSATAVRASITAPFIAPTPTKPRITRSAVDDATERSQHATDDADHEPARDHGHAAVAIHQATRRQCRERAGGEEDRGPEPEDRLDPGHEDERDRRDGDGELQHAGQRQQTEGEENRVPPDLPGLVTRARLTRGGRVAGLDELRYGGSRSDRVSVSLSRRMFASTRRGLHAGEPVARLELSNATAERYDARDVTGSSGSRAERAD